MKRVLMICTLAAALGGCGSSAVTSSGDAAKAYLGLDASIDKAITLGFQGFNSAQSANIAPQQASGAKTGTLTVTGQVDQGSSANKGMRLATAYATYSDDGTIAYVTDPSALPMLDLMLKGIPTGTFSGTLAGVVDMMGAEQGPLMLNLMFSGNLQAGANNTVERAPGSTHVTGTAVSPFGTYSVDLTH